MWHLLCTVNPCIDLPPAVCTCINGGTCDDMGRCTCGALYTGPRCEIKIDRKWHWHMALSSLRSVVNMCVCTCVCSCLRICCDYTSVNLYIHSYIFSMYVWTFAQCTVYVQIIWYKISCAMFLLNFCLVLAQLIQTRNHVWLSTLFPMPSSWPVLLCWCKYILFFDLSLNQDTGTCMSTRTK